MPQTIWYCQKCGFKNEGQFCDQCGGAKLISESSHIIFYNIFLVLISILGLTNWLVLAKVVPTFTDVYSSFGAKLPWNVSLICSLGRCLEPFKTMGFLFIFGLIIFFVINPDIKKKTKISYLIFTFFFLLFLLLFSSSACLCRQVVLETCQTRLFVNIKHSPGSGQVIDTKTTKEVL